MNKISVTYQDKLYAWIDTIVKKDEFEDILAVLINPFTGKIICIEINNIEVIDLDIRL